MQNYPFILFLILSACSRGTQTPDAGHRRVGVLETVAVSGSPLVTAEELESWLLWRIGRRDGGPKGANLQLELRPFHLTASRVIFIEEVVSSVVNERAIEKMSGSQALEAFRAQLKDLPDDVRVKAEQSLNEAKSKASPSGWQNLEKRYGKQTLQNVLEKETAVSDAWNSSF
jgi:acetylornithine deacetylase/succinyl-diaminopimelate desuccinylase-like protein